MNGILELLKNARVEWKTLGELGVFYVGLTGKNKYDFENGNKKFITYKNVYSNYSVNLDIVDTVSISEGEKQNKLEYGDVIFTGSSETLEEVGLSSVTTKEIYEDIYLNSFCFYWRLHNKSLFLPDFLKHLFRSNHLRSQIKKTASGVTRYNVSKELMRQILIPIPPIELQREIVRILDTFSELIAELQAELILRQKQYEYYRNLLLSFPHQN